MERAAAIVKRVLDTALLPVFVVIVFLGIVRSGPFFCIEGLPCLSISSDAFFIGHILSVPASTFYEVLAFWATLIGLLDIVLTFNKRAIPDFTVKAPDSCTIDENRHVIKVPAGTFPLTIQNFTFRIKNNGNLSITKDSMNYSILFPKNILITNIRGKIVNENGQVIAPNLATDVENQPDKQALGGDIPTKIYPGRSRKIFWLDLTFEEAGCYEIDYYFTTDYGFIPSGIKIDSNHEPIKNLGKIKIQIYNL